MVANPSVSTTLGWPAGFWATELTHAYYARFVGTVAIVVHAASTPATGPHCDEKGGGTMPLEHVFDAELEYRPGMLPITGNGEGQLIGSGDGSVHGPKVRGTIRWTLFEQPGDLVCTMNPTVTIETQDGASIGIEGRGYARRASRDDRRWRVAATLRFSANEPRYAWLDGALGAWEGEFDAEQHRAHYRAFIQTPAAAEPS